MRHGSLPPIFIHGTVTENVIILNGVAGSCIRIIERINQGCALDGILFYATYFLRSFYTQKFQGSGKQIDHMPILGADPLTLNSFWIIYNKRVTSATL